ncbi:MAG: hypothetical protein LBD73_06150 [Deferribacteraceae bacterium]|nr:hypothetical protein [Deferribacteraceae bacterium]
MAIHKTSALIFIATAGFHVALNRKAIVSTISKPTARAIQIFLFVMVIAMAILL